jgi:biopolymer transport protein ExbD
MKFTDSSPADEPEINVISLIDVILVLLIFFMATATFENQNRLKVNLPQAAQSTTEADKSNSFVIQINAEGRYFVGNSEVPNANLESLKTAIVAATGNARDQRVMLRADGRTPHQSVITAMDALSQLGFNNLSIATVKTGDAP